MIFLLNYFEYKFNVIEKVSTDAVEDETLKKKLVDCLIKDKSSFVMSPIGNRIARIKNGTIIIDLDNVKGHYSINANIRKTTNNYIHADFGIVDSKKNILIYSVSGDVLTCVNSCIDFLQREAEEENKLRLLKEAQYHNQRISKVVEKPKKVRPKAVKKIEEVKPVQIRNGRR